MDDDACPHLPDSICDASCVESALLTKPADNQIRQALHAEYERGVRAVLTIRCLQHQTVPQINRNESGGGECGACIAASAPTLLVEQALELRRRDVGERWNGPCQEYISDHGQVCPRCKWHAIEHPPVKEPSMTEEVRALREELSERSARVRSLKVELEAQQYCAIELMNKYESEKQRADDAERENVRLAASVRDAAAVTRHHGLVCKAIGQLAENVAEDCDHHGLRHPTWYRAVKRARKALGIEL